MLHRGHSADCLRVRPVDCEHAMSPLEQELTRQLDATRHALTISKRGVTWLESKVVSLERDNRDQSVLIQDLLKQANRLQATIESLEKQNNRLSERIFMTENSPSHS